jgi:glycosidase
MRILKNPWTQPLQYLWSGDVRNPAPSHIKQQNDSVAVVNLPSIKGIYYFTLRVSAANDTARYTTFVIRSDTGVHAFNMDTEHAPWIDKAILYEITPSAFVSNGTYDAITNKLGELKKLGINTIWLQPVYATFRKGQGYDVIDYFSLREDFGTEQQLRKLIDSARKLQLKVLFDFVPNHTSIQHPYAQDCIRYGTASHYYMFYQRELDGAVYSSYYKKDSSGFITYFWEDLVNLNFNNEEVQQWMLEACKYWVKKFDIDGYRFDAVWGIRARSPAFLKRLQTELKSIKPDLLLLAEDKGSVAAVYKAGFDAAYDWAADTTWLSYWSWQYRYDPIKNFTVFNHPEAGKRAPLLRQALFQNGDQANLRLRFMENNDVPRFLKSHNMAQTKMVAALLFSLPGVPMLYNGQEIGNLNHPYSKHTVFEAARSIRSLDSNHLFSYYQKLLQLRKKYPALQSSNMRQLPVFPVDKIVAFQRWTKGEAFVVLLNLDSTAVKAIVELKNIPNPNRKGRVYRFVDVLTNQAFYIKNSTGEIPLKGYGIRWLIAK